MNNRITDFLTRVYSPENQDSAPEKLRQAVELLREVESNQQFHVPKMTFTTKDGITFTTLDERL